MPKQVSIIFDRFKDKNFITRLIKVNVSSENTKRFDKNRFSMFKSLFRNFGLALIDNFIEQLFVLIRRKTQMKQEHQLAAEIVAGMIRGSKYWT
ncbi:unnamed protein product, partial [Adineta steineri]